jgi:hypothetical protein
MIVGTLSDALASIELSADEVAEKRAESSDAAGLCASTSSGVDDDSEPAPLDGDGGTGDKKVEATAADDAEGAVVVDVEEGAVVTAAVDAGAAVLSPDDACADAGCATGALTAAAAADSALRFGEYLVTYGTMGDISVEMSPPAAATDLASATAADRAGSDDATAGAARGAAAVLASLFRLFGDSTSRIPEDATGVATAPVFSWPRCGCACGVESTDVGSALNDAATPVRGTYTSLKSTSAGFACSVSILRCDARDSMLSGCGCVVEADVGVDVDAASVLC